MEDAAEDGLGGSVDKQQFSSGSKGCCAAEDAVLIFKVQDKVTSMLETQRSCDTSHQPEALLFRLESLLFYFLE